MPVRSKNFGLPSTPDEGGGAEVKKQSARMPSHTKSNPGLLSHAGIIRQIRRKLQRKKGDLLLRFFVSSGNRISS